MTSRCPCRCSPPSFLFVFCCAFVSGRSRRVLGCVCVSALCAGLNGGNHWKKENIRESSKNINRNAGANLRRTQRHKDREVEKKRKRQDFRTVATVFCFNRINLWKSVYIFFSDCELHYHRHCRRGCCVIILLFCSKAEWLLFSYLHTKHGLIWDKRKAYFIFWPGAWYGFALFVHSVEPYT